MKIKIEKISNILTIWKMRKKWKLLATRIIDKGYDADKLITVLDSTMIDKIVKTSPAKTFKHHQVGKVVQIRRNASIDKTDLVLLRLPNGKLVQFVNCVFFTLDEHDNTAIEKLYEYQELHQIERCFTYLENGIERKYTGAIINDKENTAKELLNDVSIIAQNLQNKFITNFY